MGLKKYISEVKTLTIHFGPKIAFGCAVRRILSFSMYERYVFDYLTEFYTPVIIDFKKRYEPDMRVDTPFRNKVWTLWWQGEECAPEVVKRCIDSQKAYFCKLGKEVVVITKDNWSKYVELPEHILKKVEDGTITLTHFSDILRAELIRRHGGLWIDATVYCIGEKYAQARFFDAGLFSVKCFETSDSLTLRRWTGFFFGDKPNSELFSFMSEAFNYYWKHNNALIAYLLIDYTIAIAYEQLPRVKASIDEIPISNPHLWYLLRKLNDRFSEPEWKKITSDTDFFKLSYKSEFNGGELTKTDSQGICTYWGYLDSADLFRDRGGQKKE